MESALYLAVWAWSVGDEVYRREWPGSVLDVGAGDGLALLPALGGQRMRVGVVEPSAALLAETTAGLERLGVVHESWRVTAQEFVAAHAGRWDVVQSSFALQSLCEADKREVLSWICGHASRFVLVEFDVPEVDDVWDPVWFAGCGSTGRIGIWWVWVSCCRWCWARSPPLPHRPITRLGSRCVV